MLVLISDEIPKVATQRSEIILAATVVFFFCVVTAFVSLVHRSFMTMTNCSHYFFGRTPIICIGTYSKDNPRKNF